MEELLQYITDYSGPGPIKEFGEGKKVPKAAAEEATRLLSEANQVVDYDAVLIGAGASGVGVAHALLRGGLPPSQILVVEAGSCVGTTFRQWHKTTRFISPSLPTYPFGIQDLNAVVPDTAILSKRHYPTGDEFADYLEGLMKDRRGGDAVRIEFETEVTDIKPRRDGYFDVRTSTGLAITARTCVWCGGEWNSPKKLPNNDDNNSNFDEDATVHYKEFILEDCLAIAENTSEEHPIVLVGGGEAGADLACALAQNGATNVLIVESSTSNPAGKDYDGDDNGDDDGDAILDPSRRLSPITLERLERSSDVVEFRSGTKCIGAMREDDGTITVKLLQNKQGHDDDGIPSVIKTSVSTKAKVIMCTGFDISQNPVIERLFRWKNGNPVLNPNTDESLKTKGLFLAGPAIVHNTDRACFLQGIGSGINYDAPGRNNDDEDRDIIFCFVYKYRTRFAIVASEILRRVIKDRHFVPQYLGATGEMRLVLTQDGQRLFNKCKKMRELYRSKGMMLEDLSCSNLACGMARCDGQVDYDTDQTEVTGDDDHIDYDTDRTELDYDGCNDLADVDDGQ